MCKKHDPRVMDRCMRKLIEWLNGSGYKTVLSCCGHGKYPMTIIIDFNEFCYQEILSGVIFDKPRRKFYKRDKQGYYFIPEIMEKQT